MIRIERTSSDHSAFIELVKLLDEYLTITDGDEHNFYDQYNGLDLIQHVVIAFDDEHALACGAIKVFDKESMEIKRMYTRSEVRGNGIASMVLLELEKWSIELGFKKCILETGIRQTEAVKFYKKNKFEIIQNYGQYKGVENSICFAKNLASLKAI